MENESNFTLKVLTLSTQLCFMNLPFLIIASKCTLGTNRKSWRQRRLLF